MKKLIIIILLTLGSFISFAAVPVEKIPYEVVQNVELFIFDYYINGVHIRVVINTFWDGSVGIWVYINGENIIREIIERIFAGDYGVIKL